MRAWLITPPHPDASKRRTITRRVGNRLVTIFRVPVSCVEVLAVESTQARIRFPSRAYGVTMLVETVAPFDRLASTREKFRSRLFSIASAVPDGSACSGVSKPGGSPAELSMPAMTAANRPGSSDA